MHALGSRLETVDVPIQAFGPNSLACDRLTKTVSISRSSVRGPQILNANNLEVLTCSLDH